MLWVAGARSFATGLLSSPFSNTANVDGEPALLSDISPSHAALRTKVRSACVSSPCCTVPEIPRCPQQYCRRGRGSDGIGAATNLPSSATQLVYFFFPLTCRQTQTDSKISEYDIRSHLHSPFSTPSKGAAGSATPAPTWLAVFALACGFCTVPESALQRSPSATHLRRFRSTLHPSSVHLPPSH